MTPEEALRHAYEADVARLPPAMRSMYPVDRLVANHLAGKPDERFFDEFALGDPRYQPQDDNERARQDAMLAGYAGVGWTPSQVQSLGRQPEPYELSPGAKLVDEIDQRAALYMAMMGEKKPAEGVSGWLNRAIGLDKLGEMFGDTGSAGFHAGNPVSAQKKPRDPAEAQRLAAVREYEQRIGRSHAYYPGTQLPEGGFVEFTNPENFIGTFANKMGPVNSDSLSQIGTALLQGGKPGEGFGNAAVRAAGSDWNRKSPVLAEEPANWREADRLVTDNRNAYLDTQGMSAGDTWRSILEPMGVPQGRIPYVQPLLNAGLSFLNGMADGSGALAATKAPRVIGGAMATGAAKSGVPLVKQFGTSTLRDMARHAKAYPTYAQRFGYQIKDEAFDPGNIAQTGVELATPPKEETTEEFKARMQQEQHRRNMGMAVLERDIHKVKRPEPYGIEGAIRRGGKAMGVNGAIDRGTQSVMGGLYKSLFGD